MLKELDLSQKLTDREEYHRRLDDHALRLLKLERSLAESATRSVIITFDGWEAAGRGECIKRVTERLDPRGYVVYDTALPTDEERARPWIWRFAVKIPRRGQMVIFHRSWYSRVLDDWVDESLSDDARRQAFDEINRFEKLIVDDGTLLFKFWLHISKREQRKRFEHFEKNPTERWKVSKDDWKEHKRYKEYRKAADAMIAATGTAHAPWTLIEANDRHYAQIKVMDILLSRLEAELHVEEAD